MQHQSTHDGISTGHMRAELRAQEDEGKLTVRDLIAVAEQSIGVLGACVLLNHFM